MLHYLKSRLEALNYKDPSSIKELDKYLAVSILLVIEDSRDTHPLQPEFIKATDSLHAINEIDYDKKKAAIIDVIDTLIADKAAKSRVPNTTELLHGKSTYSVMNEVQLDLLLVEQNNLSFFKERESHLPSQPHDRLYSHMILSWGGGYMSYNFIGDELPDYIKAEVNETIAKIAAKQMPKA